MLRLLQQRTKLSGQIGQMKRRHGAVIYVPERERELVARLTRLSKGQPPARAVAALYREIMSSSRAAQGQMPIGVLKASAPTVIPASRASFGACDQFSEKKTWAELASGVRSGALSLALLTGKDLGTSLKTGRWRREFLSSFTIAGDFAPSSETTLPLAKRVFIAVPRLSDTAARVNRILILIECKSTPNAIKSLLYSMPNYVHQVQAEPLNSRVSLVLVSLKAARAVDGIRTATDFLKAGSKAGIGVSILGMYPGTEDYGG